ncbi:MAG: hypothetical protein Kilf2KO_17860 [Rhodospirillales bacterium]
MNDKLQAEGRARRRLLALGAGGLATLAGGRPAAALCGLYPQAEVLEFQALRQGGAVGWRRIAFLREAGSLLVRSDSDLRLASGEPFRQRVEELWEEGWLVALTADTWQAGAQHSLRAERLPGSGPAVGGPGEGGPGEGGAAWSGHGGGLAGVAGRLRFNVSGFVIATTFWHRDTPHAEALLSVVDGLTKVISSRTLPNAEIDLEGRSLPARGWQIRGEWPCAVWYDRDCTLLRIARPEAEGTTLTFERRA